MVRKVACLAVAFSLLLMGVGEGASIVIPTTIVPGTADFDTGPSFAVSGNFGADDTINAQALGTVDLAGGQFTANAAGVITGTGTTNTGNHAGEVALAGNGLPFASLLIGNSSLGFRALSPADASAGLGSSTPPTSLSASNVRLGDLFGPSFTGITDGTVLQLVINDTAGLYFDNSGSFVVSTTPTITDITPEPPSLVPSGMGLIAVLGLVWCRRLTAPA